ncbi:MAG: TIGR03557 family F420-dependent LLM class oxidoreductase [Dehalococcoidia bacterium]
MVSLGYALLTEEHSARELVRNAVQAEKAGFSFATISDHFHPWLDSQGESPFAWSVLGALAHATDSLVLGTAVTCPTIRFHPAIVAQAAATVATMAPGRFFLGVGTGENLNEHVLGDPWPAPPIRLRMLEEAIDVIRALWTGDEQNFDGEFFTVDRARLYSLPEAPPSLLVAASGPEAGALAGRSGDGIIATAPDAELLQEWRDAGGEGPRMGMLHLVYARDESSARETLARHWSHAPLPGSLNADLRRPAEFMAASKFIRLEDYGDETPLGPDPERVLEKIREFEDAGYDHVILHQIGPEQAGFLRFFEEELAPRLDASPARLTGRLREVSRA